jgi:hypothetical protein
VVFGFGGNYGDCGQYQGRVVSVPETSGTPGFFTVDVGHREGAVWMGGGAPVVDGAGHIWVTAGNGSQTSSGSAYDDSDSVLELSASLQLISYFAPSDWAQQNATDADMSTVPVLLANGEVFAAGKAQVGYLLNGSHLGGIGGQQAKANLSCGEDVDGGMAYIGTTVYTPCLKGPEALAVGASPPHLTVLWRSGVGGGSPILAAGRVWTLSTSGVLYGLNPANGAVVQQASVGSESNHFSTPAVGGSYLLVPSSQHVVAFAATVASSPGPTRAPPTTHPTSSTAHPPGSATNATKALPAPVAAGQVTTPPSQPAGTASTTSSSGPSSSSSTSQSGKSASGRPGAPAATKSSGSLWWLILVAIGAALIGGGVVFARRRSAGGKPS